MVASEEVVMPDKYTNYPVPYLRTTVYYENNRFPYAMKTLELLSRKPSITKFPKLALLVIEPGTYSRRSTSISHWANEVIP